MDLISAMPYSRRTVVVTAVLCFIAIVFRSLLQPHKKVSLPIVKPLFKTPKPTPLPDVNMSKKPPIAYRPFKWGHAPVTMGIRSLNWDQWIEMDNNFVEYHDMKCKMLDTHFSDHIACVDEPVAVAASYEMLEELVAYLSGRYPNIFIMAKNSIHNTLTKETFPLLNLTPPEALATSAKLVQDDLVILVENLDGHYHVDAAAVTLPGFWRLHEKLQQSLDMLHITSHVAHYQERLQSSMNRFFAKMTPEKAVVRNNFFIQLDSGLAWSHRMGEQYGVEHTTWAKADAEGVDPAEMHFRSERQVLRRLPKSGALMFTIRTYFEPMSQIAKEPHCPGRLADAIRNWSPEMAEYKGRNLWGHILLPYLDAAHQAQVDSGVLEKTPEASFPY